jgi:hypothetical protein
MRSFVFALALLGFLMVGRADAQSTHAAPQSAIDQALAQHVDPLDADRAALDRLLARPEVREIAEKAGLDLRRAQSAAATLDASDLTRLSQHVREAEEALSGGQSRVTISTTLIIIVLLIIILLVVAID